MPIYEYRCSACGAEAEVLVRGEAMPVCPQCGAQLTKRLPSVPARVPSRVMREPGHTCCGRDERCDTPPCSVAEGCCHDAQ